MPGMIILAIVVAGTVATFTDWLFMGVLFHDRYMRHPEVWREGIIGGKDRTAVLYSCALDYLAATAIVGLCVLANITTFWPAIGVAILTWIAGPLVMMITNGFFMKIDWAIVGTHSLGHLVRFLIAAVAVAIFI